MKLREMPGRGIPADLECPGEIVIRLLRNLRQTPIGVKRVEQRINRNAQLKDQSEIIFVISAADLERNKIRADFGIPYGTDVLRQIDKLALYVQKPQPTTILVVCHKEKSADKRSAFYKQAAAQGVVFESVHPRDYEIGGWLSSYIAGKGCRIDEKALSMLTDHLGTDVAKIVNELDKLFVSLPQGTSRITDNDIENNIGISKEYNNFELCKAVLARDMARSLRIAGHFGRNPKEYPLLVTVIALFGQFRQLFILNYLYWLSRRRGTPQPSDAELMRALKVGNIYAVNELRQAMPRWPNNKVFGVLGLLREYDAKSKGIDAGGASDGELLRELVLKMLTL